MKKTILGNPDDLYNLAPIQYHWAWDKLQESFKNTWFPSEIPVAGDVYCYHNELTEDEKHLFISVFATLTTSDLCIQRNLALCVYEQIAAPEISSYIAFQMSQEVVHSASYQYIIEHLGLPETKIYELYKEVPAIRQKFDLANRMSAYFADYSNTKNVRSLLKGLVFYYLCFEGTWFYHGFSPIFSLARRGMMSQSCEQLQYIMRDEFMHFTVGSYLINGISKETGVYITKEKVKEIFDEALQSEKEYAEYAIPQVLGYNAAMHIEQTKYILNRRAESIGIKGFYEAECVLPWLDEMVNIRKEKNFFETKVTEYQKGGLHFDDTSEDITTLLDWKRGA